MRSSSSPRADARRLPPTRRSIGRSTGLPDTASAASGPCARIFSNGSPTSSARRWLGALAAPGVKPPGALDGSGFTVVPGMTSLAGCAGEDFASILRALGYRMEQRPKPVDPPPAAVGAEASPAIAPSAEVAEATEPAEEAPAAAEASTEPAEEAPAAAELAPSTEAVVEAEAAPDLIPTIEPEAVPPEAAAGPLPPDVQSISAEQPEVPADASAPPEMPPQTEVASTAIEEAAVTEAARDGSGGRTSAAAAGNDRSLASRPSGGAAPPAPAATSTAAGAPP